MVHAHLLLKTIKPSNYQTIKLSNHQTVKLSNCQTVKPSNHFYCRIYKSLKSPKIPQFHNLRDVQSFCVVVHHAGGEAEFAAGGGAVAVVVRDGRLEDALGEGIELFAE